jgi:hypothetical protein
VAIWSHAASAVVLVNALVNHPSLQKLAFDLSFHCGDNTLVGAALGALVAANAPALHHLDLSGERARSSMRWRQTRTWRRWT